MSTVGENSISSAPPLTHIANVSDGGSILEIWLAESERVSNLCTTMIPKISDFADLLKEDSHQATLIIVSRVIQMQDAIRSLIRGKSVTDAALVSLSQFELCLDLLYIAHNTTRASEWVSHEATHRQPWSVSKKIKDVYCESEEEQESARRVYEFLSGVKHGNPRMGFLGFPIRRSSGKTEVSLSKIWDESAKWHSAVILSYSTMKTIEALLAVGAVMKKLAGSRISMDLLAHAMNCHIEVTGSFNLTLSRFQNWILQND